MSNKLRPLKAGGRALLPNIVWDAIKKAWKEFRESSYYMPIVTGASTMVGTIATAILERLRGMPPDLQGILIIALVWLLLLSTVFFFGRLKARRGAAATSIQGQLTGTAEMIAATEVQELKDRITELEREAAKVETLNARVLELQDEREAFLERERQRELRKLKFIFGGEPPYLIRRPLDVSESRIEYELNIGVKNGCDDKTINDVRLVIEDSKSGDKSFQNVLLRPLDNAQPHNLNPDEEARFKVLKCIYGERRLTLYGAESELVVEDLTLWQQEFVLVASGGDVPPSRGVLRIVGQRWGSGYDFIFQEVSSS